jgi:hypothetical protein
VGEGETKRIEFVLTPIELPSPPTEAPSAPTGRPTEEATTEPF